MPPELDIIYKHSLSLCWKVAVTLSLYILYTSRVFASGPGLPHYTYELSDLFQPASKIATPHAEGYVHMYDGYLFALIALFSSGLINGFLPPPIS